MTNKQPNKSNNFLELVHWTHVPFELQYLRDWATKFGVRGPTVHFGHAPPLTVLASESELVELGEAYEKIAQREDAKKISEWCLTVRPGMPANEPKEQIRGLLLLFERLAERGVTPYTDGRVRFLSASPLQFDWRVLPPDLRTWEPWLQKFQTLRTEDDLFQYVKNANEDQLEELRVLKGLLCRSGRALLEWCERNSIEGYPAEHEAFQAEWLFLLVDFLGS